MIAHSEATGEILREMAIERKEHEIRVALVTKAKRTLDPEADA